MAQSETQSMPTRYHHHMPARCDWVHPLGLSVPVSGFLVQPQLNSPSAVSSSLTNFAFAPATPAGGGLPRHQSDSTLQQQSVVAECPSWRLGAPPPPRSSAPQGFAPPRAPPRLALLDEVTMTQVTTTTAQHRQLMSEPPRERHPSWQLRQGQRPDDYLQSNFSAPKRARSSTMMSFDGAWPEPCTGTPLSSDMNQPYFPSTEGVPAFAVPPRRHPYQPIVYCFPENYSPTLPDWRVHNQQYGRSLQQHTSCRAEKVKFLQPIDEGAGETDGGRSGTPPLRSLGLSHGAQLDRSTGGVSNSVQRKQYDIPTIPKTHEKVNESLPSHAPTTEVGLARKKPAFDLDTLLDRSFNRKRKQMIVDAEEQLEDKPPKGRIPRGGGSRRRDWMHHDKASEVSEHIFHFLCHCRKHHVKPTAGDIFSANPKLFHEFGLLYSERNKIGEHLRDIRNRRSKDPTGLLNPKSVWELWYDQQRSVTYAKSRQDDQPKSGELDPKPPSSPELDTKPLSSPPAGLTPHAGHRWCSRGYLQLGACQAPIGVDPPIGQCCQD